MKRTTLALLLVGVTTSLAAMDFHRGSYPTLVLDEISQKDLTASMKGHVVLAGKIEAVWEAGEDGVPLYSSYWLLPDADAAAKLPTLDDYQVTRIYIQNGPEALRMTAGAEVSKAFEERQTLRVTAVGTFRLSRIGMGIECGQLHVGARIDSIADVAQLATLKTVAPLRVC